MNDKQILKDQLDAMANEAAEKFDLDIKSAKAIVVRMVEEMSKPGGTSKSEGEFVSHMQDTFIKEASRNESWAVDLTNEMFGKMTAAYVNAKTKGQDPVTALSVKFNITMAAAEDAIISIKEALAS